MSGNVRRLSVFSQGNSRRRSSNYDEETSRRLPNYPREYATFFAQEMIVYIMWLRGVNLEIRRPEHRRRLRATAMFTFTPSLGDGIMIVFNRNQGVVLAESIYIWEYVQTLRRSVRREVLHSFLVVYGMNHIRHDRTPRTLMLLMAILADLCEHFCRNDLASLIGSVVSALEFVLTRFVDGGFARALIRLNNYALQLRVYVDTHY